MCIVVNRFPFVLISRLCSFRVDMKSRSELILRQSSLHNEVSFEPRIPNHGTHHGLFLFSCILKTLEALFDFL